MFVKYESKFCKYYLSRNDANRTNNVLYDVYVLLPYLPVDAMILIFHNKNFRKYVLKLKPSKGSAFFVVHCSFQLYHDNR